MPTVALLVGRQFSALTGTARIEVALVALAVVLGTVLVIVRMTRASRSRRRKAAGTAFFDHDAAHYGRSGRQTESVGADSGNRVGPTSRLRHSSVQPLAATFTSPTSTSKARPGAAERPGTADTNGRSTGSAPAGTDGTDGTDDGRAGTLGPPKAEPVASPVLAPLPSLRPKGTLPSSLPPMPEPDPPAHQPPDPTS